MIKGSFVTLLREDLAEHKKDKSIDELSLSDFKILPDEIIYEQELIQFVDINGRTKIFKNRYGSDGFVNEYGLNKEDLINLVEGVSPKSTYECDRLTKIGLMEFCGNQHNEDWRWVKSSLNQMSKKELLETYQKYK